MSQVSLTSRLSMMSLLLLSQAGLADSKDTAIEFHSGPQRVPVLELFTSEGCSSCPQADAWLAQQQDNPNLWKTIVPMAWHVDYWDALGWPDTFAQMAYSRRQRLYEATGHLSQVYTPGLVFAGQEWRGFFKQADLPVLINPTAGELTMQLNDRQLRITFAANRSNSKAVAHVALLGFGLETAVRRGENAGKRLRHDFVVLAHRTLAPQLPASGSDFRIWQGELPASAQTAKRYALVGWIAEGQDPTPLQSTGGFLP